MSNSIRCLQCRTHEAVVAGNYYNVSIYQCTNPACNFEDAPTHIMEKFESWTDYPTRQLANVTDGLKFGLYHEFKWWLPDYQRHKPIRWTPRQPSEDDDGTEGLYWQA